MTNDNLPSRHQMPMCGNEDRLFIVGTILRPVTDGGADIADAQTCTG